MASKIISHSKLLQPCHRGSMSLLALALVTSLAGINGSVIPGNLEEIVHTVSSGSLGSIPLQLWSMSEELIPEIMIKAAEWMENSDSATTGDKGTEGHREKRASEGPRLLDWVRAYRKDPETYSCVRKIVCEMLAKSSLAEQSVKSPLGGTIMSMLGRAVEHGPEMVDLVTEVVGDPDKCLYFAPNEICG